MKSHVNSITRRDALLRGMLGLAAASQLGSAADEPPGVITAESLKQILQKARGFLVDLMDNDLELLLEYHGAKVYWIFHDNYLAAKVLNESHPQTAKQIRAAMKREGVEYSGKIELLFGELKQPLPFRQFQLKDVRRIGDKVIRTEVVLSDVVVGWQSYADFLLMACLAEKDPKSAWQAWDLALKMWDGKGFVDEATKQLKSYSTYKLALALLAAYWVPKAEVPDGLVHRLSSLQDPSGGWITDYDASGKKIGLANVETTCLSILGLEGVKGTLEPLR
ncbi:MAG: hypothetical protein WCH39_25100 [Schlesneria sp.]